VGGADFGGVAGEFFEGGLDLADEGAGGRGLELVEAAFEFEAPAAVKEGSANGDLVAVCWGGDFGGGAEFAVPVAAELHAPARGGAGLADGARAGSEGGEFADGEGGGAVREVGGHKAGREDR
jgi:hypothetical protein